MEMLPPESEHFDKHVIVPSLHVLCWVEICYSFSVDSILQLYHTKSRCCYAQNFAAARGCSRRSASLQNKQLSSSGDSKCFYLLFHEKSFKTSVIVSKFY